MDRAKRRRAAGFVCAAAALLPSVGCISVVEPMRDEELAGAPTYEALPAAGDTEAAAPFVGLELTEAVAGGLDSLEFLPGLRVAAVVAASPAEAAGIAVGDRVLKAAGADLRSVDQWQALLAAATPGAPLALEIDRGGALATATVAVVRRSGGALTTAARFIERKRLQCTARTVVAGPAPGCTGAQLEELAPGSVLRDAGLRAGDLLVELDGSPIVGAPDLFVRVAAAPLGDTLQLVVLDPDGTRRAASLHLPPPDRHLTELSLWPLFSWSETPDEQKGELVLLDLWLIWLFKREHDGEATKSSILRFLSWESGVGALAEEAGAGEDAR